MTNDRLREIIEESYQDYIKKAYVIAVDNSLMGESNAVARFENALKTCTKVRDEILKRTE